MLVLFREKLTFKNTDEMFKLYRRTTPATHIQVGEITYKHTKTHTSKSGVVLLHYRNDAEHHTLDMLVNPNGYLKRIYAYYSFKKGSAYI